MPSCDTSASITETVWGIRYFLRIWSRITSPPCGVPGCSALDTKPSPSIWAVRILRPDSVVVSIIGRLSSCSALRKNMKGSKSQNSESSGPFSKINGDTATPPLWETKIGVKMLPASSLKVSQASLPGATGNAFADRFGSLLPSNVPTDTCFDSSSPLPCGTAVPFDDIRL